MAPMNRKTNQKKLMGEGRKIVSSSEGGNEWQSRRKIPAVHWENTRSMFHQESKRSSTQETRDPTAECTESKGHDPELAKRARTGSPSRTDAEMLASSSDSSLTSCSSSEDLEGVFCFEGNTNLKPNMNLDLRVGILVSGGEVSGERTRPSHGSVAVCGRRREMEDAVVVAPRLVVAGDSVLYDFFGVYDGHGGAMVAEACRDRLHRIVAAEVEARRVGGDGGEVDWKGVMESSFAKMDGEIVEAAGNEAAAAAGNEAAAAAIKTIGSTAVVAMVGTEKVVVSNCGDSRAVLSRGGVPVPLSRDHKPDRPDEMERVEAAGGRVINWNGYRVLGVLATSRSIGDHYLKPYVISQPEVIVTGRKEEDEFLILASDGLWDVVPNEMACEVTRLCLAGQLKNRFLGSSSDAAAEAAALLAELAMGRGSNDNISVVVVELRKANGR